jgi:hypothetical protein
MGVVWEKEGRSGNTGRDMGFTMDENQKIWEEVVKNGNAEYRSEVKKCDQPGCVNGWVRDILKSGKPIKCPMCNGYGFKLK